MSLDLNKHKFISDFLIIEPTTRTLLEDKVQEVIYSSVKIVEKFCKLKQFNEAGLYITGSASIGDIIVNDMSEFLSDIDLILMFNDNDEGAYNINLISEINHLLEREMISVNLSFSTLLKRENINEASTARLQHLALKEFQFKELRPKFNQKSLYTVLYIVPPSIKDSSQCFYSNIKFLKRSLEFLVGELLATNPTMSELIANPRIEQSDKVKIRFFFMQQLKSSVPLELSLDIYHFTKYFLDTYILKALGSREHYSITKDKKLNITFNKYIEILSASKLENSEIKKINSTSWDIQRSQKVIKTITKAIDGNILVAGINEFLKEETSLLKILSKQSEVIAFINLEINSRNISPLILMAIGSAQKNDIPLTIKDNHEYIDLNSIKSKFLTIRNS
jgi:SepF-like predicted cell division protein (DUF552 family)